MARKPDGYRMLEKYKLKPGDEGYLNEAGRRRYLIYASILTAILLLLGYLFFKNPGEVV